MSALGGRQDAALTKDRHVIIEIQMAASNIHCLPGRHADLMRDEIVPDIDTASDAELPCHHSVHPHDGSGMLAALTDVSFELARDCFSVARL